MEITTTLQRIIDERISFLKEQINHQNKLEVNKTFQVQIDAIRSVHDMEKVELIIELKKAQIKKSKKLQQQELRYCYYCCSICGKRLRFSGKNEYLLTCWQCMMLDNNTNSV